MEQTPITTETAASTPHVAVDSVSKAYGSREVVVDVSLHVQRGEAVALLGPNGAGKSTLFGLITGVHQPDRGRVEVDGTDVTGMHLYKRAQHGLSYLPQDSSVFRGLSVEDNILLYLEQFEPDVRLRRERLLGLLLEFGLEELRKRKASRLSGGERRRCEIARALAARPKYVLLDEPFAGIDPLAIAQLQRTITKLRRWQLGVLISDHNVRDALAIVDRGYIMDSGRILAHGTPAQIAVNEQVRRSYTGTSLDDGWPTIQTKEPTIARNRAPRNSDRRVRS